MKTNKEIKPFKMRCSQNQVLIVENILKYAGISINFVASRGVDLCCIVYANKTFSILKTGIYDYAGEKDSPELTYSEFMKLYGDEYEVFTREDMIMFAYGTLCSLSHSSTEEDVEHLLTAYLYTRTND